MKLTIAVNKPPNGASFQSGDNVDGSVQLVMDEARDVPDIKVYFQGTAKITLKPGFDAKAQIGDTLRTRSVKLFSLVQEVHPVRCDADETDEEDSSAPPAKRPQQTVSAPFSFVFPTSARCCRTGRSDKAGCCRLPPSTLVSTQGLKVSVSYAVTVVCRRPGGRLCHLLRRSMAACQLLPYMPPVGEQLWYGSALSKPSVSTDVLRAVDAVGAVDAVDVVDTADAVDTVSTEDTAAPEAVPAIPAPSTVPTLATPPPRLQLIRSTAWLPATNLGVDVGGGDKHAAPHPNTLLPPGCLPPYSPAMTLEVVMPSPPVITPGEPVALGLFLRTPRGMLDAVARKKGGLQLRSLAVRLRRQTQGCIGPALRVDDTTWPMWSVHGSVPVRQERLDISWGPFHGERGEGAAHRNLLLMGVPAADAIAGHPGFWTCYASRAYSVEVTMGVAVVSGHKKRSVSEVQYARTAVRVMVSEPPPDYEGTEDEAA